MSYEVIDEVLFDAQKRVHPFRYLSAVNGGKVWKHFKETGEVLPWEYQDCPYDQKEVQKVLRALDIPEGPLGDAYRAKVKELLLFSELIEKKNEPAEVRRITKELFGSPSDELVECAETVLQEAAHEMPKGVTPQEVYDSLRKELDRLGCDEWTVEYSPRYITTVTTTERKITVCEDKNFHQGDPDRLRVHEVNVHVLRSHNGAQQRIGLFGLGFAGYMETEEGLAAYAEEIAEVGTMIGLRKYAARVIAVHMMDQGVPFLECFKELKQYKAFEGCKPSTVWAIAARAYRSGGFYKDHLYLQGYLNLKTYVAQGGDLGLLWVGKVGLSNIPLVKELIASGEIKAMRVPDFVSKAE